MTNDPTTNPAKKSLHFSKPVVTVLPQTQTSIHTERLAQPPSQETYAVAVQEPQQNQASLLEDYNELLTMMLAIVTDVISEYCNNSFNHNRIALRICRVAKFYLVSTTGANPVTLGRISEKRYAVFASRNHGQSSTTR
ncbi:uncharacterized protein LOC143254031 [Tachypleus tridentatus]|uniref:uncharacterized protein LOC143254031 n=1 Tax=Tachypleus tridentatus TaxID=6853 RepID=UPI003FCFD8BE